MICNNSGGALFHSSYYKQVKTFSTIDRHVAAEHCTSVKGWTISQGFKYLSADNKDMFDKNLELFLSEGSSEPIVFEVFTDKDNDIKQMNGILNSFRPATSRTLTAVASKLPEPAKRQIKKLLGRT